MIGTGGLRVEQKKYNVGIDEIFCGSCSANVFFAIE